MRVLFAGPSLGDITMPRTIECRGPARRGDFLKALADGACAIGLIDGYFGDTPTIGHKEILFALSRGVPVIGGGSIGALRAVECSKFGMEGQGTVFEEYREGTRFEDADVALLHAPAELDYLPVTLPLVDVEAVLKICSLPVSRDERIAIQRCAKNIHFTQRNWQAILTEAELDLKLLPILQDCTISVKSEDARLVIKRLNIVSVPGATSAFQATNYFLQDVERYAPSLVKQL